MLFDGVLPYELARRCPKLIKRFENYHFARHNFVSIKSISEQPLLSYHCIHYDSIKTFCSLLSLIFQLQNAHHYCFRNNRM